MLNFFFVLFFNISNSSCFAFDKPFISSNNWGGTGLLEIPTARILEENTYRIGISQIHPYRHYYGAIGLFKRFEIMARINEILGVKVKKPGWEGYGNYKDKEVEIKFQILKEGKYTPAIAIGIKDPHGTRIYASNYIVLSKQIYPFDFTIGLGNGWFGKKPLPNTKGVKVEIFQHPREWWKDSKIFFGFQWALTDKLFLMFEYWPTKYNKQTKDPAWKKYFKGKKNPSPYNFGIRWKPFKWLDLVLSYQRGEEIGLNLSTNFHIGRPLIPIYNEIEPVKKGPATLEERLTKALAKSGFSDIGIFYEGKILYIFVQNDKYYYSTS
ncbi:MAG: hypothetical protein DRP29_10445, partial [Thermodesulfobacteriota bacterium]